MAQNSENTPAALIGTLQPAEIAEKESLALGTTQRALRDMIARRHPEYKAKEEHWAFLESTYSGGREWFEKNIFQYVKEGEEEFKARKERAYRFNHTREVVDLVDKHLFRQGIQRNEADAPEPIKQFWKRATRNGLSIDDLDRQISKAGSIFGRIGIVVDNNMPSGLVMTVAEAKRMDASTYAYIVTPRQLLDYSFDDIGELNWILIEESYREDENPIAKATDVKTRWRLWTRNEWMLFEEREVGRKKEIQLVGQSFHELGVVPVILHDNIISDAEWTSSALIDEIAYLDRAVANYLSNLDAIIQDQTFSQLAMPAQSVPVGDSDDYKKMVEVGTKRIFLYDSEGGIPPGYISPDVKQAQLIVEAISKIINEIYHTVGLAGERTKEDNSVGIDNSSGVAKAYDFERVNSLLASKATALEATENKINDMVCRWAGVELDKKLVHYPENFDTRSLYDEFDIAAKLILIEAPDDVRREQMRMVIDKMFPLPSEKLAAELKSAIDAWTPIPLIAPEAPGTTPTKSKRQGQVTSATK